MPSSIAAIRSPASALKGFRLPASMLRGLNQARLGSNEVPGPSPPKTLTRTTTSEEQQRDDLQRHQHHLQPAEASVPITQTVVIAAISSTAPITTAASES